MAQWRRDGWDSAVSVGLLVPHADVGPEKEVSAMLGAAGTVHGARAPFAAMKAAGAMDPTIALEPVRAFAEPPGIDVAAELVAASPVDVIGFGFTSSAYVIGADGEAAMVERLSEHTRGIPVVATCASALAALDRLGAKRLAVVSPPWFDADLDRLGADYFAAAGLEVVAHGPAPLTSDQRAIEPGAFHDAVRDATPDTADAVFIGGNGFRAVGAIDALEQTLDRPVLTANQVLLWGMLTAAGTDVRPDGYGRIFTA